MKPAKRARIYERDGNRCVDCGSDKDLTLDHIRPVSHGGGDEDANLQTLCSPCNNAKGNRLTDDGKAVPVRRRRKLPRILGGNRPQHHPLCDANYCFCECPVYLMDHPELARALRG